MGLFFPYKAGKSKPLRHYKFCLSSLSHLFRLSRKDKGAGSAKTRQKAQGRQPVTAIISFAAQKDYPFSCSAAQKGTDFFGYGAAGIFNEHRLRKTHVFNQTGIHIFHGLFSYEFHPYPSNTTCAMARSFV